jgi:hypothetical protein
MKRVFATVALSAAAVLFFTGCAAADGADEQEDPEPIAEQSAAVSGPCGHFNSSEGTSWAVTYYRNCRSKAVKITVDRAYQLDWTFCIPARRTVKISDAWRYRGHTIDKVYDGSYCP